MGLVEKIIATFKSGETHQKVQNVTASAFCPIHSNRRVFSSSFVAASVIVCL